MYNTQVLWAVCNELPAGWSVRQHSHDFFHLFYVRVGRMTFHSGNTHYHLCNGDIIIFPPNVDHEIPHDEHTLCEMYEVKFRILNTDMQKAWDNGKALWSNNTSHLENMLRYITYHWCLKNKHVSDSIDSFLTAILFSLTANNAASQSIYIDTSQYSDLTKKIIFYVENNYMEDYSLSRLTSELGYNKNYICSAFRRNTGISISSYYTFVRIRRILYILYYLDTSGETKINILSQSVGYKDASHFNRVFKKMTGVTPGEYVKALATNGETPSALAIYYEKHLGTHILPLHQGIRYINGIKNVIKRF